MSGSYQDYMEKRMRRVFAASASKQQASSKPKGKKKRLPPVSVRFSESELAQLKRDAAGLALGAYIKAVLFDDGKKPRKPRQKQIIKEHEKLALVLGLLGKLNALKAFDMVLAGDGVSNDLRAELRGACSDIRLIRHYLITALGIKAED